MKLVEFIDGLFIECNCFDDQILKIFDEDSGKSYCVRRNGDRVDSININNDEYEKLKDFEITHIQSSLSSCCDDTKTDSENSNIEISLNINTRIDIHVSNKNENKLYNSKYECFVERVYLNEIEVDEVFIFRNEKFRKISNRVVTDRCDVEDGQPNVLNLENEHLCTFCNHCSACKIVKGDDENE